MEAITVQKTIFNGAEINSVNSRELHAQLKVKTQYSLWIQRAIQKYGFEENIDYSKLNSRNPNGGIEITDYIATIDMAKELCMLDDSLNGKSFRKYFIECEKKLKVPMLPQTYIAALEALAESEKAKLKLTQTITAKNEIILAVADLNIRAGDITIADFAKNLAIEEMGQNNMFSWLKARGFLMMDTAPYQQYVERGYFVRKPYPQEIGGEVRYKTMLTARGSVWLTRLIKAEYDLQD